MYLSKYLYLLNIHLPWVGLMAQVVEPVLCLCEIQGLIPGTARLPGEGLSLEHKQQMNLYAPYFILTLRHAIEGRGSFGVPFC